MPILPQKRSQVPASTSPRKDPPQRELEGYYSTRLTNSDPAKVYRFVYTGKDDQMGVDMYEHLGFEKVFAEEGGVRMAKKKTPKGDLIQHLGHILMAADRSEIEERAAQMQREADEREQAIVKNRGGLDPMRGINRNVIASGELKFVNETEQWDSGRTNG